MIRAARCCAVLAAAAALAVACTSFTSEDPPPTDPADAAAIDASTSPDGSSLDGGSPDGTGASFCASLSPKPVFCADFDESPSATTGFDEQLGTMRLDSRFAVSSPASLLASTLDGGGKPNAISWLGRTLAAEAGAQTASFMIRLGDDDGGAVPSQPYGIVFRLLIGEWTLDIDVAGIGYVDFQLQTGDGGGIDDRVPLLRRPIPGVWTKVELRLAAAGALGGVRAELDIGGQPAIPPYTSRIPKLSKSPRLILGLVYTNDAVARYDNVVFDSK